VSFATRKCGCGECRFSDRKECPDKDSQKAYWLYINKKWSDTAGAMIDREATRVERVIDDEVPMCDEAG
jgi:hypothetical protein